MKNTYKQITNRACLVTQVQIEFLGYYDFKKDNKEKVESLFVLELEESDAELIV